MNEKELFFENVVRTHQQQVMGFIGTFVTKLICRGLAHDHSKFDPEERESFIENSMGLSKLTYGSDEYRRALSKMKPAIEQHYHKNKHHPEYWSLGLNGMSLIDITEMLCDWMAAVKRHEDGNIHKSLEINRERFNISDQLYMILQNTIARMDTIE